MKNKGIAIELTALLDVILIMLFWVMMNMERQSENVREEAESRIAASEQKYEEMYDSMTSALNQKQAVIDKYEGLTDESVAAANQKALDNFSEGRLITLNLSYDAVGTLSVLDENGELGHTLITSREEIADKITACLKDAGLSENDVILCALVYDGDRARYKDMKLIKLAADDVAGSYGKFYCTYINVSR